MQLAGNKTQCPLRSSQRLCLRLFYSVVLCQQHQAWDCFCRMRHIVEELGVGVKSVTPAAHLFLPVTFSLGHFSLQALARDSCTSKGSVQTERGGEMAAKEKREKEKGMH